MELETVHMGCGPRGCGSKRPETSVLLYFFIAQIVYVALMTWGPERFDIWQHVSTKK